MDFDLETAEVVRATYCSGLGWNGWTGLDWAGLGWTRLNYNGLDLTGTDSAGLEWTGLDSAELAWIWLGWAGMRSAAWVGLVWTGLRSAGCAGLDCTGSHWAALGCTGLHWARLGWTQLALQFNSTRITLEKGQKLFSGPERSDEFCNVNSISFGLGDLPL